MEFFNFLPPYFTKNKNLDVEVYGIFQKNYLQLELLIHIPQRHL